MSTDTPAQPTDLLHKFRGVQAFLESCWRQANTGIGVYRDDLGIAIRTLQEALDEAAASLQPTAAQPLTWQPIETAPKDGTMFLCWVLAERWTGMDGESSSHGHDVSQVDFCWWRSVFDAPEGGYFDNAGGQIADRQDVTHWMPLPAQPGASAAPTQAAYKDSTPHLSVGDSAFEDWFQAQPFATQSGIKQMCRDSYAAGMGDPLVCAKERAAPVAELVEALREARVLLAAEGYAEGCHTFQQIDAALSRAPGAPNA